MYRPKQLEPVDKQTLDTIAPEDRTDVINFLDEYGQDLKAALKKPVIKHSKKLI